MLLAALCGCASVPPPPTTVESSRRVPATFDAAWAAAVDAITDAALPIKAIEKASGVLTTDFVSMARNVRVVPAIDSVAVRSHQMGGLASWTAARYSLSILVSRASDSTTVIRVTPHIEGYESITREWAVLATRGAIERRFLDSIEARLR